jgi:uncharacterized protein (TIGR00645 family)
MPDTKEQVTAEGYDFHRLSSHLTRSLTNSLYREYSDTAKELYERRGEDDDHSNDLDVKKLVEEIKSESEATIRSAVAAELAKRIVFELDAQHKSRHPFTQRIEKLVKFIRFLVLPLYACLALVIVALVLLASAETAHVMKQSLQAFTHSLSVLDSENFRHLVNSASSGILSVLDLVLIGSLVVMVVIGGYENSVARLGSSHDVPTWFGKLDIGDLKIKVAASIVIISSIHLLTSFIQIKFVTPQVNVAAPALEHYFPLIFTTVIHVVFVISAYMLAMMDPHRGSK